MVKTTQTSHAELLVFTPPLLLYCYPGIMLFFADSQTPIYVNRFSLFLLLLLTINSLTFLASLLFLVSRKYLIGQLSLCCLAVMSLAVVGNNFVSRLPFMELILPLIRFSSAISLAILAFMRLRSRQGGTRPFFAISIVVILLSLTDFFVYGMIQAMRNEKGVADDGYRDHYDLTLIKDIDALFVGDSFVWGEGVEKQDRFCSKTETYWRELGRLSKVYCLGRVGAGLEEYERILQTIPKSVNARNVYVFYYHNDFPPEANAWRSLDIFFEILSASSKSFILVKDLFVRFTDPDVHEHHGFLVGNYDQAGQNFDLRWRLFEARLANIYDLARNIALGEVYFVILPLAVNFRPYALSEVDERIGSAADALGYKALNPISFLVERGIVEGDAYRAGPNDNHYNPDLNDQIARYLVIGHLAE
jgi:hypothetical protein